MSSYGVDDFEGKEECQMFHGTDSRSAQLIVRQQQFRPSESGLLGKGVYLTPTLQKAQGYRVHHPMAVATRNAPLGNGTSDPGCILEFRVRLGACKIVTRDISMAALTNWHDEPAEDVSLADLRAMHAKEQTQIAFVESTRRGQRARYNSARSPGCSCCKIHGDACPGITARHQGILYTLACMYV